MTTNRVAEMLERLTAEHQIRLQEFYRTQRWLDDPRCAEIQKFYYKIVDLYLADNTSILMDLNGFGVERAISYQQSQRPFLGKEWYDRPSAFLYALSNFVTNCLWDDASCFVKWVALAKSEQVINRKSFLLPFRDKENNWVYMVVAPFTPGSTPVIIADWSGDTGTQDVAELNLVVEWYEAEVVRRKKLEDEAIAKFRTSR